MKQSLLLIFLLYGVYGMVLTAQVKLPADSARLALMAINPDSSAIGAPIGARAFKTIGPDGGKIISADSMMELTFPAGALASATEIGLQPVENTSLAGFGNAYACTPDGIHFKKPVQMLIRYTDSAAKGISPATQTIRWQDKSGRWTQVEKVKADSAARSLACKIEHFSNLAAGTTFKLIPGDPHVKVKQERLFMLVISGTYPDGKQYSSGVEADIKFWPGHAVEWSVNGIPGGNDVTGRIRSFSADQMNGAFYTAPAVVPAGKVKISAKYIGPVPMGPGSVTQDVISTTTADVYDEFHYKFIGYNKTGHLQMIDSATCDIQAFSSGKVQLSNIQNPTPWSDWPPRLEKCSFDYPDKTGWKGMIQIVGMSSGTFLRTAAIPPSIPASTQVLIQLIPTTGSTPRYTAHCVKRTTNVPSYPVSASPGSIQFELMPSGNIWVSYGSAGGLNTLDDIHGNQGFTISVSHKP